MKLLIIGCGYVGSEVAKLFQQKYPGDATVVYAMTRSESRRDELLNLGVLPIVGDWLSGTFELPEVDQVLVAVPHREGNGLAAHTHVQGLANVMASLSSSVTRWIYLSTTGVYGEGADGEVVDEETPVSPTRLGPEIALAAEEWLAQANSSVAAATTVLRLAGIYGPGRIPLATKLQAGEPLAVPLYGHLNLVHVADIAEVICQMLARSMNRPVYVLSDGQPVLREVFYRELARLCHVENPQFAEPGSTDSRQRRSGDKRINPARIVGELNYQFRFPDFRAGLVDSLKAEQ